MDPPTPSDSCTKRRRIHFPQDSSSSAQYEATEEKKGSDTSGIPPWESLLDIFNHADSFACLYIEEDTIAKTSLSVEPATSRTDIQAYIRSSIRGKRMLTLDLPQALTAAVSLSFATARAATDAMQGSCLIGICWAIVRSICENERINVLDSDEKNLFTPLKQFSIPAAMVTTIREKLHMYTLSRQAAVVDGFDKLQERLLRMLHTSARPLAIQRIKTRGDDAITLAPQFIEVQRLAVVNGTALARIVTLHADGEAWTDSRSSPSLFSDRAARASRPTKEPRQSPWAISEYAPLTITNVAPLPLNIALAPPRTVSDAVYTRMWTQALRQRSNLSAWQISQPVPNLSLALHQTLKYEETLVITRWLILSHCRPFQELPTAEDNRRMTITEVQFVLRSIGLFSESTADQSVVRHRENGLRLNEEAFVANYDTLWDEVNHFLLVQLETAGCFGAAISTSTSSTLQVLPMYQEVYSSVPRAHCNRNSTRVKYYVQAIREEAAGKILQNRRIIGTLRGIPHGPQCSPVTSTILLGLKIMFVVLFTKLALLTPPLLTSTPIQ